MFLVLVTGSHSLTAAEREWTERAVADELSALADKVGAHHLHLIHGNAWGVDKAAHHVAETKEFAQISVFPAQWKLFGNRAGFVRNESMINLIKYSAGDAVCLAFLPKGIETPGTANTIELARKINVPVKVIKRELAK